MEYTAVIRTLGKGGDYYQKTLDSLILQSIPPSAIIVYIAEGYALPAETVHREQYVYVKKGMVAQRALQYKKVKTEYILFLDDDVYLPPTGVETLYHELQQYKGDVISPYVFYNHKKSIKEKIRLAVFGREVCRLFGNRWGFKVLSTAGFSYINNPKKAVYESQTNAGPCFLCRKEDFLNIKYEDELWLDETPYAFPDDQVMFYKMYLNGLKILTSYDSGIDHLDAGSSTGGVDRTCKVIYSEYRNKLIFWYRFLYSNEKNYLLRLWKIACITYVYGLQSVNAGYKLLRWKREEANAFFRATKDALNFIRNKK
ncbi:glycosyltransferase family 2 protein [uncultured Prevotella sp.]|uniref:glycosyltransferase family 2 protein n=1 Tax=uncultured Prevotella sp. TaxID=159272 RepID=UPI0025D4C8D1|nr:glycosyltransferase family 2 protein [uncultured Prevotella sp.]